MSVFQPNLILKDVTRIDRALLRANGLRGLILDVDNTLTLHDSQMLRGMYVLGLNRCARRTFK